MKKFFTFLGIFIGSASFAQGPFDPGVNSPGFVAVQKDSMIIYDWVSNCTVVRGSQNISIPSAPLANVGDESLVSGKSDGAVLSLGDGGVATIALNQPMEDHGGYDFAIFENGIFDLVNEGYFLELAFVEVSSDGVNFYRFPNESLTPSSTQTSSFGFTDPTMIDGLAGKHSIGYGTPFDLIKLDTVVGLDITAITHIRLIDVVGSINPTLPSYDSYSRIVNDPFPTEFGSCGFDLDAIALIDTSLITSIQNVASSSFQVFPNPVLDWINIKSERSQTFVLLNINGEVVRSVEGMDLRINLSDLPKGLYILQTTTERSNEFTKIIKL